jgi:hypothetical protein
MTTTYAVLFPGDEKPWADADPERRSEVYGRHGEFMRLLEERGHRMTGGAELAHSSGAKVVRGRLDEVTVTDGPYAETVEQLTGFYLVDTDDLDDLLQLCGLLSDGDAVEVRACVPGPDGADS